MGIWNQKGRIENFGLNPVAGNLVRTLGGYSWGRACARLARENDRLARVTQLLVLVTDLQGFLQSTPAHEVEGERRFFDKLDSALGRTLRPQRPSPKGKSAED